MDIIVVGCGKVGFTIVEQLSNEGHNIVAIDERPECIDKVKEELDVMGITGNGVSYQVLMEAGIATTDLLISVTGSDEQNLLCCLIAKKTGKCQTIARVRNPVYSKEIEFFKNEFGLAMIINPEYATADEISRIFQFPSAIKIDPFAGGKVEMLHFRITKNSRLNGEQVNSIRTHINKNILIAAVDRNDHIIIPNGDFTFQENDTVSIIGKRREAVDFFKKCGLITNPIKSAMIAGGGKISYYLARNLLRAGVNVTIIEIDQKRCEELAELLPKATIICGDATDQCVLEQEGLLKTQGFAVLTGLDEENILVTLYARNNSDAKIITKINRINFTSVINELHLDCVVNPRIIMADHIIRYVRSSKKSDESNVENLYKMKEGKAEALEFIIKERSAITDIPLKELQIKDNILICSIYRNGEIIIPSGQDTIQVGDSVVIIVANKRISNIREILRS